MSKPPNASGNPTKKKPMNPRPKMAKFVLTTCAACLARQKPVSTSANPACMKMTRIAPITTHSMFEAAGDGRRRIGSLGERDGAAEERHEQRSCGTSQRVLQHTFPTHQLSLVRGPWTWSPARGDPCAS